MSIPASLLQHAEAHSCFSGCYGSDPDVSVCLDPARPLSPLIVVSCHDCFARLGVPRASLPSGATSSWLAGQLTQHLRKQRGFALSFSGYHTKGPGFWLGAAYYGNLRPVPAQWRTLPRPGERSGPAPAGVPSRRGLAPRPTHAGPAPVRHAGNLRAFHRSDGGNRQPAGPGHLAALPVPALGRLPACDPGRVSTAGPDRDAAGSGQVGGQCDGGPPRPSSPATSALSAARNSASAPCSRGRTSAACAERTRRALYQRARLRSRMALKRIGRSAFPG